MATSTRSSATPLNPPDSPPKGPIIPEGLATKLGKFGALATAILAALAQIFDVEIDSATLAAFAGSIVLLVTTMAGRYAQAAAIYRDQPSALANRGLQTADELEDFIETEGPSEEELKAQYPEDPPPSSSSLGMNRP